MGTGDLFVAPGDMAHTVMSAANTWPWVSGCTLLRRC